MSKTLILFLVFFLSVLPAVACEVCQRNQPKLLQDISHGTGPQATSDYYIIGVSVLIVVFTLIYSLKFLLKPGEKNPGHIKNLILNQHPEL